jgi:hypothetical protein
MRASIKFDVGDRKMQGYCVPTVCQLEIFRPNFEERQKNIKQTCVSSKLILELPNTTLKKNGGESTVAKFPQRKFEFWLRKKWNL